MIVSIVHDKVTLMATILSGASGTVLRYMRTHWLELVQINLLPFLAIMAILATEFAMFGALLSSILAMVEQEQVNSSIYLDVLKFQGLSLLFTLGIGFIGAWQFVRITRLYLRSELSWIGLGKPVIIATLMTMLYALGIALIASLAFVVGVFVIAVPVAVIGSVSEAHPAWGVMAAPLMLAAMLGYVWFACRFAIGLPAVALGETPDFFKDLWGISKGETWGYPLRLLGAMIVLFIVLIPVTLIYGFFVFGKIWMELTAEPGLDAVSPEFLRGLFDNLVVGQLLWGAIMQPATWFFALLTAECYRRFKAKRSGDVVAAAPGSITI
jgi:multisubunit Na+/H+ antiporter MnhG subunit